MKPSAYKNIKIYLADGIHSSGISILRSKGFTVAELTGLNNDELMNLIIGDVSKNETSALIVRSVRKIDKPVIDRLHKHTNVRVVCTASSGFDNIDSGYAFKKGIDVLNVPFGNYVSAAEHTMAMILALIKNITRAGNDMKSGIFDAGRYENKELLGKTIGIVGVGRVGSYVARLSKSFGMKILGNDIDRSLVKKYKWIKFTNLNELLKRSDIITIHTPLDRTTYNLIGANKLKLLKSDSILINCARGGIVNEKALINKLRNRKLFYAGVDVFVNEPDIRGVFKTLSNIIITPHLAGKTRESRLRISTQLAERIITYFGKMKVKAKKSNLKY